jgi:hypothetical protein
MFNSVVLDVFIGLVLIYLLYSLLITIVGELLVSWIGLRSRILRVSIEKMLNDGYYYKRPDIFKNFLWFAWFVVQRFFLKEFKAFKHSFAGKFYEYPSIKYLAARGGEKKTLFTETKPSYFSDEIFADTIIQMLKDKGAGATDFERVKFALAFNTYMIQPATLKRMRDIAANAGDDINDFKKNLKAWYNETQDRTSGWYKRKMQVILFWLGFILAIIFNVDSLRIARILSKDEKARDQLVNMGIQLSKDSVRYKEFLNKNDSTLLPQAVLDSGYKHVTKDIAEANMVLGLSWGTDTLTCPLEETIDGAMDDRFSDIKTQQSIFDSSRKNIVRSRFLIDSVDNEIDTALEELNLAEIHMLQKNDSNTFRPVMDSIRNVIAQNKAQKTRDSLIIAHSMPRYNKVTSVINNTLNTNFVSIHSIDTDTAQRITVKGRRLYDAGEKFGFVMGAIFRDYRLVGFIITGLMLSLGAPFWFDLLKKLVSIRSDGVKPEEKKVKNTDVVITDNTVVRTSPAPASGMNITGDAADEALKTYHDLIRKIPGVKSVFTAMDRETRKKFVQVNVDTGATKDEVLSKFPVLRVGGMPVKHVVMVSGVPVSNIGEEGTISNKSGRNGFGTLGCQLKRTDTGEFHILSCWHVMKGNRDYNNSDDLNIIIDNKNRDCAKRWAGGIRGAFDYGIASYPGGSTNFNDFLKQKLNITGDGAITTREIDRGDIDNMITVKYYDCLAAEVKTGFLFANSAEVTINYFDRDRVIRDVLMITNNEEKSISRPGNSGSIIFDEKNVAIAMVISGDKNYTYAVKLSHIFAIHDEMIIA